MEELAGPKRLQEFQDAIQKRWAESPMSAGITHCNTHQTDFCVLDEPCWMCYQEFDKD